MNKATLIKYLLVLYLGLPSFAKADICFRTFEEDTTIAQAIFVGKVVKIEESQFWHNGPKTIFTFEITESFKGLWKGLSYVSIIGPIHGCCNEHFVMDSTFLVFAYGDGQKSTLLWTNDCSNTGLLSEQKVLYQKLGIGIKHKSDPDLLKLLNDPGATQDSLLQIIEDLNLRNAVIMKDKDRLRSITIVLILVSAALLTLMIFRKKK